MLRTMGSTTLAGGFQVGVQEAGLQSAQRTRTTSESLMNIGTGALLAGPHRWRCRQVHVEGRTSGVARAMEENRRIPRAIGGGCCGVRSADGRASPHAERDLRGYTRGQRGRLPRFPMWARRRKPS